MNIFELGKAYNIKYGGEKNKLRKFEGYFVDETPYFWIFEVRCIGGITYKECILKSDRCIDSSLRVEGVRLPPIPKPLFTEEIERMKFQNYRALTEETKSKIVKLRKTGMSIESVSKAVNITNTAVRNFIKRMEI